MAKKRKSRVRFARVPSGVDTCKFCAMLASRGAVYSSEETAGKEIHENCHCTCVPSWGGSEIEGYDPKEYYDRWKHPEIYEGLDSIIANSLACLRVAEKRGFVKYDKPLLSFLNTEDGKRDLVAHAALVRNGKRFRALAEDAPEGFSNIDLEMDGAKWEVKSPPGDNPRAVESNLRKAKKQFAKNYPEPLGETRVIFNGYFYGQEDEWVAAKLSWESSRHGIDEVLYVDKNVQFKKIEKVRTPYPERPDLQTKGSIAHSASSMEEHRSPKPTTEVRSLGGVPDSNVLNEGKQGPPQVISRAKHGLPSGRVAYSQEELDEVIARRLPGLRFPVKPEYVPNLKNYGETTGVEIIPGFPDGGYKIKSIKIGPQKSGDEDELVDTILHELLEARALLRGDEKLAGGDKTMHSHIDRVIEKYGKMRAWKQ